MKKALLALALLAGAASPAFAQVVPNLAGIDQQNAQALQALLDTRWIGQTVLSNGGAASSNRVLVPVPGHLREVWIVLNSAFTPSAGGGGLRVGVAISRANGAQQWVGEVFLTNTLQNRDTGGTADLNFPAGQVTVNEGDVIVVGTQSSGGVGNTPVVNVFLRVGA